MIGRGTASTSRRLLRWWGCRPPARLSALGGSSKPAPPPPPRRTTDITSQKVETSHMLLTSSLLFPQNLKDVTGNPLWICRGSVNHYKRASFRGTYRTQSRSFVSAAMNFPRSPTFSKLTNDDINHFKNVLGDKNVIQDEDRLSTANLDWMRKYRGSSQLLLLPRSTKEVSQILHYCNSRCLAVVLQGGNTGLVGGSVPVYDEVAGILVCEAGCILENVDAFLANQGKYGEPVHALSTNSLYKGHEPFFKVFKVTLMASIKRLLDPNGILNLYKVLPQSLVLPK